SFAPSWPESIPPDFAELRPTIIFIFGHFPPYSGEIARRPRPHPVTAFSRLIGLSIQLASVPRDGFGHGLPACRSARRSWSCRIRAGLVARPEFLEPRGT